MPWKMQIQHNHAGTRIWQTLALRLDKLKRTLTVGDNLNFNAGIEFR